MVHYIPTSHNFDGHGNQHRRGWLSIWILVRMSCKRTWFHILRMDQMLFCKGIFILKIITLEKGRVTRPGPVALRVASIVETVVFDLPSTSSLSATCGNIPICQFWIAKFCSIFLSSWVNLIDHPGSCTKWKKINFLKWFLHVVVNMISHFFVPT